MKKSLASIVLGVALIAAPASAGSPAPASADAVFPRGLAHAPSEEECYTYRCVWDAKHQGNGKGHSLILTRFRGDYIAKRITHRRAHRLQTAYCARPRVNCEGYRD